ncbi:MAG: hypothetical protein IH851_10965 [Armatimonadetes bacterium]|nr:hypothetical protein [Armatimonadota bacterium]
MIVPALVIAALAGPHAPPQVPLASEGPLEITNLSVTPESPKRFEPVEITFELSGTWTNPFRPSELDVTATVVGARNTYAIVHAFLYQPFERSLNGREEVLTPSGPLVWKVRFAPWNTGSYGVFVRAADTLSKTEHPKIGIKVSGSESPDFVNVPKDSSHFRIGENPFFPVGPSLSYAGLRGTFEIEERLAALAKAGVNFCHLRLSPENLGLEWSPRLPGYRGLGQYNLQNAWKLDFVIEAARRHGIYILLALGVTGELSDTSGAEGGGWAANPYSRANGGPCVRPEEFWTSLKARILYKRRLRYLISRIGHHPNVLGFELWHSQEAPDYWVTEMANEIYGLHAFGLPVGTTFSDEKIWSLKRVGFATVRSSLAGTPAGTASLIANDIRTAREETEKPILVILDSSPQDAAGARSALYSAMLGGAAGGAILPEPGPNAKWRAEDVYPAFAEFSGRFKWAKRRFETRTVIAGGLVRGWGMADRFGGAVYLTAVDGPAEAGTATTTGVRDGTYSYEWIYPATGDTAAEGEARTDRGELTLPYPAFESDLAAEIRRK